MRLYLTCWGSGLVDLLFYLSNQEKEYWGEKGRGRAGLAKMCEFLMNLVDSADGSQVPALLPEVLKGGQTTRLLEDGWVWDWEMREEGDPDPDLISGNCAVGTLCRALWKYSHVTHVNQSLGTCHPWRRNNNCQCQSTTSITYRQLDDLKQASTGHLKFPRILLPAPIMSRFEPRKEEIKTRPSLPFHIANVATRLRRKGKA